MPKSKKLRGHKVKADVPYNDQSSSLISKAKDFSKKRSKRYLGKIDESFILLEKKASSAENIDGDNSTEADVSIIQNDESFRLIKPEVSVSNTNKSKQQIAIREAARYVLYV